MGTGSTSERASACAYEAVFCIFLTAMSLAVRRWPSEHWISALIILVSCGASAALMRRFVNAERRSTRDERTEKLARMGLITASIVHDLKNPISVIRGYTEICLKQPSLDPKVKKNLEQISLSALFCQDLVSGILRAANDEEAPRISCDIHQRLEAAIELSGNINASSGIEIQRRFSSRPLRVLAAPEQLERLFLNLIGNAAKAMPSGGRLTLRTQADERMNGFARAEVIVEDTGTGISDDAFAKLFKPFGTTRPCEGGTGLGLYLCRDIAIKNGGSLAAENIPSAGARFILSLPLEPAPDVAGALRSI